MCKRPEMWGDNHAVEMQALLLLEFDLCLRENDPSRALNLYVAELLRRFPQQPNWTLTDLHARCCPEIPFGDLLLDVHKSIQLTVSAPVPPKCAEKTENAVWRLDKEKRDSLLKAATFSYRNRRHLDKLGD
jgi:hypothetical protein